MDELGYDLKRVIKMMRLRTKWILETQRNYLKRENKNNLKRECSSKKKGEKWGKYLIERLIDDGREWSESSLKLEKEGKKN